MSSDRGPNSNLQAVLAGFIVTVVGFTSSFTIVLAGLRGVGATDDQAASGLLILCVTMGLVAIWLGLKFRMPISIAWSTPGAALLISTGEVPGGWPAAIGAFIVAGGLIVLAGFWTRLSAWIASIPAPIASAMLAGVLLPICLGPVQGVVDLPAQVAPVILAWIVVLRFARPWAVPAALVAAGIAIAIDPADGAGAGTGVLPVLDFTTPEFTLGAIIGIGLPLFIVTMTSQNVTGMTVLASFGYRPPLRPILVGTGAASIAGAPFGGHAINLAAITAALAAGPDAHPDPERRWITSVTAGAIYVPLGLAAGAATTLVASAPPEVIEAVAGLALLGALGGSLAAALKDSHDRDAAVVTLVVAASGITAFSISAPFWALVAGLLYRAVMPSPTAQG